MNSRTHVLTPCLARGRQPACSSRQTRVSRFSSLRSNPEYGTHSITAGPKAEPPTPVPAAPLPPPALELETSCNLASPPGPPWPEEVQELGEGQATGSHHCADCPAALLRAPRAALQARVHRSGVLPVGPQQCKPWGGGGHRSTVLKGSRSPKPHTSARHLPESGVLGDTEYTRQGPCPQSLGHILETTRQQGGRWNMILGELIHSSPFVKQGTTQRSVSSSKTYGDCQVHQRFTLDLLAATY